MNEFKSGKRVYSAKLIIRGSTGVPRKEVQDYEPSI